MSRETSGISGQASTRTAIRAPLAEGWMIHFMLDQPDRRLRHYWILTGGAINMYNEYNDGRFFSIVLEVMRLSVILTDLLFSFFPHRTRRLKNVEEGRELRRGKRDAILKLG